CAACRLFVVLVFGNQVCHSSESLKFKVRHLSESTKTHIDSRKAKITKNPQKNVKKRKKSLIFLLFNHF
ncbi:hypothetical protein, partial [Citrobacter sp. W6]|uniref:hypothetical protein n=1 Tax=Citrobacter sp. W6 TaxID=2998570 RepID=UPI00227CA4AB